MLGIFGGTFDPIHYGHLRVALEVQENLELESIIFIPLSIAVHRPQPIATAPQRLAMLQAAIAEQPGFLIDDAELNRTVPSYTLYTIIELQRKWPHVGLNLLIGYDAFQCFLNWKQPLEILNLVNLVVMQRPGIAMLSINENLNNLLNQRLCKSPQQLINSTGRIFMQPVTQLDISSSFIRTQLATNKRVRFLVPDAVLNIIQKHKLYC